MQYTCAIQFAIACSNLETKEEHREERRRKEICGITCDLWFVKVSPAPNNCGGLNCNCPPNNPGVCPLRKRFISFCPLLGSTVLEVFSDLVLNVQMVSSQQRVWQFFG
jgi:hypothetical protein